MNYKDLPVGLLKRHRHRNVTLEIDIMYINGIPFIITISCCKHFGMVELIKNKKTITIPCPSNMLHTMEGILCQTILWHGKFECIRKAQDGTGINLNITGRDEHIPAIKRFIWTDKEGEQGIAN